KDKHHVHLTNGLNCNIVPPITNYYQPLQNRGVIMSVRKRAWVTRNGEARESWIVDYSDQRGRHIHTFARKKDADEYHDKVRVDVRAGVHTSSKATAASAGKRWIESCKAHGLEASTVESYEQHLNDHILPYLGIVQLSQLTVPVARTFERRAPV